MPRHPEAIRYLPNGEREPPAPQPISSKDLYNAIWS